MFGDLSRRHSWDFFPFAGLLPTAGAAMFPTSRASMLFADRSPRFVFVAEPSVQRESMCEKGRAIMSFRFSFGALTPVIDPAQRDFSRDELILPWAFPLAGFWAPSSGRIAAGTTARRSSASGSRRRKRRETYPLMGLTAT